MKIDNKQIIPAALADVRSIIEDPVKLAQAIPGCQELTPLGENRYQFVLAIPTGPLHDRYEGVATVVQAELSDSSQLNFVGRGQNGSVQGNGRIHLEVQEQTTSLTYEGALQLAGKPSDFSERLVGANVNALIRRSAEGIGRQLQPDQAAATADTPRSPGPFQAVSANKQVAAGLIGLAGLIFWFWKRQVN